MNKKERNYKTVFAVDDFDNIIQWSYSLARTWAIENLVEQGVTSARKFDQYKKAKKYLPKHFPKIPDEYFIRRESWKGWKHFLGNPKTNNKKSFVNYEVASKISVENNIRNSVDYRNWKKRPDNLPARPELQYKEWSSWESFLGNSYKQDSPKHNSKLKESDVRIIKHQLKMGIAGSVLAKAFNVSEMQISRIKSGENWSNVSV